MAEASGKQLSFRLPSALVDRIEQCAEGLRERGLDVTRTDVVRLLLKHALDATDCRLDLLIRPPPNRKKTKKTK